MFSWWSRESPVSPSILPDTEQIEMPRALTAATPLVFPVSTAPAHQGTYALPARDGQGFVREGQVPPAVGYITDLGD